PLPQQIRERAERMGERVEQWLGKLDAAQRQRILVWAHTLGEQNRLWLENRRHWQLALLETLSDRHEGEFEQHMVRLLQERESRATDAYRAALAPSESGTSALISGRYAPSEAQRRLHLESRVQRRGKDLGSLDCLPAAQA